MLDRSVNVRFPQEILHRLETRLAKINAQRADAIAEGRECSLPDWLKDGAHTMSDEVRRTVQVGLDVLEGDADAIEDLFLEHYAVRLQALLAHAVIDPKAAKQLKRIADTSTTKAKAESEPNFG